MSVTRRSHHRMIEKIEELDFETRKITTTPQCTTIELHIFDEDALYRLLAGDANKFFLASRISDFRACQNQTANAAWQTIEHYYAAYFAVHYLTRLTGSGITNLDNVAVNKILRSCLTEKPATSPPTGMYTTHYDESTKTLSFKSKNKGGGSHQEAWQQWVNLIVKLTTEAKNDEDEYARTSLFLSDHKNYILRSEGHYRPPIIRGEINYQFKGKTWEFEKDSTATIRKLQKLITENPTQPQTKIETPENLMEHNKIIILLAKEVFIHASTRYPKSICSSLANKYKQYLQ